MGKRIVLAIALAALLAPGRVFAWTDTLTAGTTPMRKVHVDELRTAINAKRAAFGFAAASWTDPTITAGSTLIRKVHMDELRDKIDDIHATYRAICPTYVPAVPSWTDPTITAGATLIRATHLTQLRSVVDGVIGTPTATDLCCPTCKYPAGASGCLNLANGSPDTGCGGSTYTCYQDPSTFLFTAYYNSCASGACGSALYMDCYGGQCVGNNLYSMSACNVNTGCTGSFVQTCASTGYFCSAGKRYVYTGCSGGGCTSALVDNCNTYYCSVGKLYLYNGCTGTACTSVLNSNCNTYYCSGMTIYLYNGCSGTACTSALVTTCTGAYYCSGACAQYSGSTCVNGVGTCQGGAYIQDCCLLYSGGYCSSGTCY